MDDLGEINALRREIKTIELQIEDLEKWGTIPTDKDPFVVNGSKPSVVVPNSPTEQWVKKIEGLKEKLLWKKEELTERLVGIELWLEEVTDSQTRAIIRSHYLLGKTWKEVAMDVCNSQDKSTAYRVVERYISTYKSSKK